MTSWLLTVYAVGGALEIAGVTVTVIEFRETRAESYRLINALLAPNTPYSLPDNPPPPDFVTLVGAPVDRLIVPTLFAVSAVLNGNRKRRAWGLGALLAGLLLGVVGNIASVIWT